MTLPETAVTASEPVAFKPTLGSLFFLVALLLALIDTFLKPQWLIGGWHIVFYLLLLLPLAVLHMREDVRNRYTLWFVPFVLIWIGEMFYYNNTLTQCFLPPILISLTLLLYLSATQETSAAYQSLLPKFAAPFSPFVFLSSWVHTTFAFRKDKHLVARIGIAVGLTAPFFIVFTLLLRSADSQFDTFFAGLLNIQRYFSAEGIIETPLKTLLLMVFFLYAASNTARREPVKQGTRLDPLIVSIFLGTLTLLFASFIALQIPFLLQDNATFYADKKVDHIAFFARQGFFQLMAVMAIVVTIYLVFIKRFQGERSLKGLMMLLLLETMVMGIVSIKKMALYQWLMGATVLRYYVEWFDYFLLGVLGLGILWMFQRIRFHRLLDTVVISGLIAFTTVASINIDYLVASHNTEKFAATPEKLDAKALRQLSVDALPALAVANISAGDAMFEEQRCDSFATYHYGYCSRLQYYTMLKVP